MDNMTKGWFIVMMLWLAGITFNQMRLLRKDNIKRREEFFADVSRNNHKDA